MEIYIAKHGAGNGDAAYDETYEPRHCAGQGERGCLHNHHRNRPPQRGVMKLLAPLFFGGRAA